MDRRENRIVQLFLDHHHFVRGMAVRLAPYPHMADDVVQQVFTELLVGKDKWNTEQDVRPLLATLTRNIAYAAWRQKAKSLPEKLEKIADHVRKIAKDNVRPEQFEQEQAVLYQCLDQLPAKSRDLIQIHYFEGVKIKELADRLELKSNTLCRAFCRLRDKLRDCIEKKLKENLENEF